VSLIADVAEQTHRYPSSGRFGNGTPRCGQRGSGPGAGDVAAADSFALPERTGGSTGWSTTRVVMELQLRAHCEPLIELLARSGPGAAQRPQPTNR